MANNKQLKKKLKQLDFTENMAKVYIALAKLGQARSRDVIKETGLHRNIVYNNLDKLVDRDLTTKKKQDKVNVYQALDPNRIIQKIKQKEKVAENAVEEINDIRKKDKQEIRIREGEREVKETLFEIAKNLKEESIWKVLGANNKWNNILSESEQKRLLELQKNKKFTKKIIAPHKNSTLKETKEKLKELIQIKTTPEITSNSTEINILKDKIISIILVEPYTVIEIENKEFVDSYHNHFELLWNQDVFTYRSWEEMQDLFLNKLLPSLSSGDCEYIISTYSEDKTYKKLNELFVEYNKQITNKGVNKKFLTYEDSIERIEEEMKKSGVEKQTQIRRLPEGYQSGLNFQIYPDYVVMAVWSDEPSVTLYTQDQVVEGYREHFEFLWEIAN